MMGDLSLNFSRHEFACNCKEDCGYDTVDYELIEVLEDLRSHFGKAITINSGHRCPTYNSEVGGAPRSVHLTGKAADIVISNCHPYDVQKYLKEKYHGKYGIGSYSTFTHIDVRRGPARWGK